MSERWNWLLKRRLGAGLALAAALGALWAGPALAQEWQTYLKDDFDSVETMFYTGQAGEAFYAVDEKARYVVDGMEAQADSLSALTDSLYYYYVEASCSIESTADAENAFCGLIFHYNKKVEGVLAYYVFYLYPDGYFGAKRVIGDRVDIVIPLTYSDLIELNKSNILGVDAQGTRFDLYINGRFVQGFTDVRIDGGGFGFYVSKLTRGVFDDFKVKVERNGGKEGLETPEDEGDGAESDFQGYTPPIIPRDPNRPVYPWEVGVDKSGKGKGKGKGKSKMEGPAEPADDKAIPVEDAKPPEEKPAPPEEEPAPAEPPAVEPTQPEPEPTPPEVEPAPEPEPEPEPAPPVAEPEPPAPEPEPAPPPEKPAAPAAAEPEPAKAPRAVAPAEPAPAAEPLTLTPPTESTPEPAPAEPAALPAVDPAEVAQPAGEELLPLDPAPEEPAVEPEPVLEPEPVVEPEPVAEPDHAPASAPRRAPEQGGTPPVADTPITTLPAETPAEPTTAPAAEPEPAPVPADAAPEQPEAPSENGAAVEIPLMSSETMPRLPEDTPAAEEPGAEDTEGSGGGELSLLPPGSADPPVVEPEAAPELAAEVAPEAPAEATEPVEAEPAAEEAAEAAPPVAEPGTPVKPKSKRGIKTGGDDWGTDEVVESTPPAPPAEPTAAAAEPEAEPAEVPVNEPEPAPAIEHEPVKPAETAPEPELELIPPEAATPDDTASTEAPAAAEPVLEPLAVDGTTLDDLTGDAPAEPAADATEPAAEEGPVLLDPFQGRDDVVLLEDDFSEKHWQESEAGSAKYRYFGAAYEVDNRGASTMAISYQQAAHGDTALSVDCEFLDGANFVGYGVGARFSVLEGKVSYYGLFISASGEVLLLKVLGGREVVLKPWTPTSQLKPTAPNRIELVVAGDTLQALINGKLVAEARDNELRGGGYALLVGPGAQARFDNLRLIALPR